MIKIQDRILLREIALTFRNAFLIYNPLAGGLSGKRFRRLDQSLEELRSDGHGVTVMPTSRPGHASELAAQCVASGADLVIVAGGDGTINETMNGLVSARVPLAVLPAGTANVLATELGLGPGMRRAARQLKSLHPVRIAAGCLTTGQQQRHFLMMAGFGLDAGIVAAVHPGNKKRLGKIAYWLAGFSQVGRRLPQLLVRAEGRELRTGFALASRVRNYGGDLEIARTASLLSGEFELITFEGATTLPYLKYLYGVVTGRLARMRGVTVLKTRRAEFMPLGGEPIYAQIDGEEAGQIPARVDIVPESLTLLTPQSLALKYGLPRLPEPAHS